MQFYVSLELRTLLAPQVDNVTANNVDEELKHSIDLKQAEKESDR